MNLDREYAELGKRILKAKKIYPTRPGVDAYKVFGASIKHSFIQNGFPIITTKHINFNSVAAELLWFLKGTTNIKFLNDLGVHIWDAWADMFGELGPVYGKQWRDWGGSHDQIKNLIAELSCDPYSRRALVSAWNVAELSSMALPPCPVMFQVDLEVATEDDKAKMALRSYKGLSSAYGRDFAISEKRKPVYKLNMAVFQRSADYFLGLPFDLSSFGALMVLLSNELNAIPGELYWSGGNVHIYSNHIPQVKKLLTRKSMHTRSNCPWLHISNKASVNSIQMSDIDLFNYVSHKKIPAKIAV